MAAGNSIIPPTANISSGKTSVCSRPLVEASRSASVPGSAAAWPANAEHAALEPPLGEEQHAAEREDEHQAPEEQRRAVDRDACPRPTTVPRLAGRRAGVPRSRATSTDADAARRPGRRSASTTWTR